MSRMVSSRQLVGRRIVGFDPRPFPDDRGGVAHNPVIRLDDGSQLAFIIEETEHGEYGTRIVRSPPTPTKSPEPAKPRLRLMTAQLQRKGKRRG